MNYTVKKYGAWLFGIVDSNGMFVKKPDGELLTFKSKKDAADHIKTLTESVADMHKRCEKCNTLLNDGGTCPKCDDGEEDYGDELKESAASDGWVKSDKSGKQVSTNSAGMTLINHSDKGLNADVFHWSVVDADGETLLDTGKLYYGYDISHSIAKDSGHWSRKVIYGDAIILKCIADKYNFNDEDILSVLKAGIDNRYRAACGILHDVPGWKNAQQIVSEAESANIIGKFTVKESKLTESVSCKYVAQECDSDFAEEIALMAMRAMRLREHEADTLQKDLEDGLATNWVSAFEKLPDSSDVKKLFFQFAVKCVDELEEDYNSRTLSNEVKDTIEHIVNDMFEVGHPDADAWSFVQEDLMGLDYDESSAKKYFLELLANGVEDTASSEDEYDDEF